MATTSPHAAPVQSFTSAAVQKATWVTGGFAVFGGIALVVSVAPREYLWPSAILFALILLNTFFSVRIFSSIIPASDRVQQGVDVTLGVLYLCMILTIGQPFWFPAVCSVMFIIATLKYVLLIGRIPHRALLRHKIVIDAVGAAGAIAALVLAIAGYPLGALWAWALLFAIVQIDIFVLHPLYVFHAGDK